MIVKNESKIIERLFDSVRPFIDSYCICDTGSTDDTIEKIRAYGELHKIPGKIMEEPFRDFGYNRTYALQGCYDMPDVDYILLMDADMKLEIKVEDIDEFKRTLTSDVYYMIQGSPSFYNKNIRMLQKNHVYSYKGVTHEYVEIPDGLTISQIEKTDLFINDIGDGGSKENKFRRDITLLTQGLEDEPDNSRYLFYLANSYRDSREYVMAIETYKKRIQKAGWIQEIWHSYYSIGNCYMHMKDYPNAIYYWLQAHNSTPTRIESLYKIVNYYRNVSNHQLAITFYDIAHNIRSLKLYKESLFLEQDVYDYKLEYELSIIGYYCKVPVVHTMSCIMYILNCVTAPISIKKSVLSNYKFYVPTLITNAISTKYTEQLNKNRPEGEVGQEFVTSTPSIWMDDNNLYVNTRYVNYRISSNGAYTDYKGGNYTSDTKIVTKNVLSVFDIREPILKKTNEFIVKYNESYDGLYAGIEDIRLIVKDGIVNFNGNRGISWGNIVIETGVIDMDSHETNTKIATKDGIYNVEKNWVFTDNSSMNVIYQWYPLTIGHYHNDVVDADNQPRTTFTTIKTIQTPQFFTLLRGSTNGVIIGDDIWIITHLVSDENRRYYYHVMVILDKTTYELKNYSVPFSFEKNKIEYTLGFVYLEQDNQFLIGYSTNDSTTNYMAVSKTYIETLLCSSE